jgi:DNA-directed RNA polymerase subunit H (RpoH/RPB5)
MSGTMINAIYKSRKTLISQLSLQGYDVSEYEHFGIMELNIMVQTKQLDMIMEKKSVNPLSKPKKVYVRYFSGKVFRPASIQELVDEVFVDLLTKEDTLLIVTPEDCNDSAKEFIKQIWETDKLFIISISIKRLQYNILQHIINPLHTIIDESEVNDIKISFNITKTEMFPEISRFDPTAIAIGMRPGEICRIERPSKTSIIGLYYRLCVNN